MHPCLVPPCPLSQHATARHRAPPRATARHRAPPRHARSRRATIRLRGLQLKPSTALRSAAPVDPAVHTSARARWPPGPAAADLCWAPRGAALCQGPRAMEPGEGQRKRAPQRHDVPKSILETVEFKCYCYKVRGDVNATGAATARPARRALLLSPALVPLRTPDGPGAIGQRCDSCGDQRHCASQSKAAGQAGASSCSRRSSRRGGGSRSRLGAAAPAAACTCCHPRRALPLIAPAALPLARCHHHLPPS
jgi:hypothetical protein